MRAHKSPDFQQRQSDASAAKQAMMQRARAAASDPAIAERKTARDEMAKARAVRIAAQKEAKRARDAELAEEAARIVEAERLAELEEANAAAARAAEEAERQLVLLNEQKAARDARYAARKAAKKERRKG